MEEPPVSTTPETNSTPVPYYSLKSKLLCFAAGLVVLVLVAIASFVFGRASVKPSPLSQNLPIPTTALPTPTPDPIANWKTYQNKNVTFKFPSDWIEKPQLLGGSGFTQEFEDSGGKFTFTFSSTGNYSQLTGKPHTTIDEFINMPYKVKTITINGQEGRQPLPRAGSENVNSVMFFSKDLTFIYILSLETGNTPLDTPKTDVAEGQRLFDQILSTFRFD